MQHVDLGERRLSYVRQGRGEPLLLIQGMAGHHRMWRQDFLDLLAERFDVVAYDHRGVGESTDVPGPFGVADLADDAAALVAAIGWPSAHVLGISLGGMVAQELALRRPELVRGLVLGCTYSGGPGSALDAPGPMRMLQAMNSGVLDDAVRAGYLANLSSGYTAQDARWPEFREHALAVRVPVQVVLRQAQAAFGHDTSARLPGLAAPTLVLAGTADEMVRFANSELIAGLIPSARLEALEGVGHLFWWERPDEVAAAVAAHLAGTPAAR